MAEDTPKKNQITIPSSVLPNFTGLSALCAQRKSDLACSAILASRLLSLGGDALWRSEGKSMNLMAASVISSADSKLASGLQASDKSRDRDSGEILPWLPCTLALDIPVIKFRIGNLLSLTKGSIVETAYHQSSDLPLSVNGQLVGWTEFEVVGDRLAVRLTDLS
jgi:flagellar motor switch/type III secretory pathway protein FliN